MSFRPDDLHDFDVAREIRIETHHDPHVTHTTVIWIVADNGQLFVRSVRGANGRWYQEALADPNVTVDDGGRRLEMRAVPVHDADSIRRVTEALRRKYAASDGLDEMLQTGVLDATLRLEPRFKGEGSLEAPAYLGADQPSELGPPIEVGLLDGGPPIDESIILQPHKPV